VRLMRWGDPEIDFEQWVKSSLPSTTLARWWGRTETDIKSFVFGTVLARAKSVARYITISLGILLGVLILGSLGTFFLYVPILPFAAVVTVLLGLILMFILGVQTGGRRIRVLRRKNNSRLPEWCSLKRAE
jgi:uncharacterized membrane protein YedE/YeeE